MTSETPARDDHKQFEHHLTQCAVEHLAAHALDVDTAEEEAQ